MLIFLCTLIALACAVVLGAKYHAQVNEKLGKLFNNSDNLPVDFRIWLVSHRGQYESIGAAMSAWADAKYGNRFDNLLR